MFTVRKLATVILVVLGMALAVSATSQASVTTTPIGWVPVAYGDAQLSAPANFSVIYPDEYPCNVFPVVGTIFLGPIGPPDTCLTSSNKGPEATVVYFRLERFPSEWLSGQQPVTRNGLRLYVASVDGIFGYYSPLLGVVVAASGPLAQQVLDTLAPSPRMLALAAGPVPRAPVSWHSVTFAGLRFLAPASWQVDKPRRRLVLDTSAECRGVAFWQTAVVLSTEHAPHDCPGLPLERPYPQPPTIAFRSIRA